MAFVYASLEVLFPAWVSLAYPPERMGAVLCTGSLGYVIGFAGWRWRLGRLANLLALSLIIQALILMGAGLQVFAHRPLFWFGAVFVFSAALPVVIAALTKLGGLGSSGRTAALFLVALWLRMGNPVVCFFRSTAYGR